MIKLWNSIYELIIANIGNNKLHKLGIDYITMLDHILPM